MARTKIRGYRVPQIKLRRTKDWYMLNGLWFESSLRYDKYRTYAIKYGYCRVPYRTGTVPCGTGTVLYGTVPYGTVMQSLKFAGFGFDRFATTICIGPKPPDDVFCIVLYGPNEHKDYLASGRGSIGLRPGPNYTKTRS